jgi:hypothetical protein
MRSTPLVNDRFPPAPLVNDEPRLCAVLPFPVLKLDAGELVVPPREYQTIRRPETLAV